MRNLNFKVIKLGQVWARRRTLIFFWTLKKKITSCYNVSLVRNYYFVCIICICCICFESTSISYFAHKNEYNIWASLFGVIMIRKKSFDLKIFNENDIFPNCYQNWQDFQWNTELLSPWWNEIPSIHFVSQTLIQIQGKQRIEFSSPSQFQM